MVNDLLRSHDILRNISILDKASLIRRYKVRGNMGEPKSKHFGDDFLDEVNENDRLEIR